MIKNYDEQSSRLKALAHPIRLRIVEGLILKECNVNKIVGALKIPQSTVSQHLGVLKNQGIVGTRKEGVKTCYRVIDPKIVELVRLLGR